MYSGVFTSTTAVDRAKKHDVVAIDGSRKTPHVGGETANCISVGVDFILGQLSKMGGDPHEYLRVGPNHQKESLLPCEGAIAWTSPELVDAFRESGRVQSILPEDGGRTIVCTTFANMPKRLTDNARFVGFVMGSVNHPSAGPMGVVYPLYSSVTCQISGLAQCVNIRDVYPLNAFDSIAMAIPPAPAGGAALATHRPMIVGAALGAWVNDNLFIGKALQNTKNHNIGQLDVLISR